MAEADETSTAEQQQPATKVPAGKKHKQHKQKQDKQQQYQQDEDLGKPRKDRKRRVFGVTLLVLAVLAVTLGFGVPKAAQVRRLTCVDCKQTRRDLQPRSCSKAACL
jgi:hypothetical protein